MKKVTAFVGSARKRHTYAITEQFLNNLRSMGDIETEIVRLSDYRIEHCRGCQICFEKGEEFCPLKGDRDALIAKIMASDGVVFASPNYAFQISSLMKAFIDKMGYLFHRPCFFGKTSTSIVAQGTFGGNKLVAYLDFISGGLGFNTVKGICVTTLEPMTEKQQLKNDRAMAALSRRYYARLMRPAYPVPSLLQLMIFRIGRTSRKLMLDDSVRDHTYFTEKGWYTADYYYPTRLGPLKRGLGKLFDALAVGMVKAR